MPELILHHYGISAFSERARLAMGLKGLAYRSVEVPALMPKPDQTALTGGYRRAPVLQVGADVYCDSALILRVLEGLHPAPTLYPGGEGIAAALAWWADKALFPPALGLVGNVKAGQIPPDFVAERKAFGFNLDPEDIGPLLPAFRGQAVAQVGLLESMLADGRPFLLGAAPSVADLAAHGSVWLLRTQGGDGAEALASTRGLDGWYGRVEGLGHGRPAPMSGAEALEAARGAEPAEAGVSGPAGDLPPGSAVAVTPDDTGRDPVRGVLVGADAERVVIRRDDPRLGAVQVHFPRAGFDVAAA